MRGESAKLRASRFPRLLTFFVCASFGLGAAPQRETGSARTPAPVTPAQTSILVLDGRTNQPVPGAEVLWAIDPIQDESGSPEDFDEGLQRARRRLTRTVAETLALVANGERAKTDAEGRVALPENQYKLVYVARKDALLGCGKWTSFTPPDRCTLVM